MSCEYISSLSSLAVLLQKGNAEMLAHEEERTHDGMEEDGCLDTQKGSCGTRTHDEDTTHEKNQK